MNAAMTPLRIAIVIEDGREMAVLIDRKWSEHQNDVISYTHEEQHTPCSLAYARKQRDAYRSVIDASDSKMGKEMQSLYETPNTMVCIVPIDTKAIWET